MAGTIESLIGQVDEAKRRISSIVKNTSIL